MTNELSTYINIGGLLNFKVKVVNDNRKFYDKDVRLSRLWNSERAYLTERHKENKIESFYNYLDICFEFRVARIKGLASKEELKDKWLNIILGFETWKI